MDITVIILVFAVGSVVIQRQAGVKRQHVAAISVTLSGKKHSPCEDQDLAHYIFFGFNYSIPH
jgi:hypothetical protein